MKKVARLRMPADEAYVTAYNHATPLGSEHVGVRTTGRIKKPKAVFDPSDNYLPRSHRVSGVASTATTAITGSIATSNDVAVDRRKLSLPPLSAEPLQDKKVVRSSSTTSTSATNSASSSSVADSVDVCSVCFKREAKRGAYAKNKLITCLDCDTKVHKLCLKVVFEDLDTLRQNYKCDNCRSCDVCAAFSEFDSKHKELVTCAKCVKSYHLNCHIPSVLKFQQLHKNWKCNKCMLPVLGDAGALPVKAIREIIGHEPVATKAVQQQQSNINLPSATTEAKNAADAATSAAKRTHTESKNEQIVNGTSVDADDADYPDIEQKKHRSSRDNADQLVENATSVESASGIAAVRYSPNEPMDLPEVKDWDVNQVVEFFAKYFPNEAHVFKEQEIDGMSLLLLKRSDVIKKLPIKLGPSLRIYSLILKIQTQLNDATLGWNCEL